MSDFKGTPGPWHVENNNVFIEIRSKDGQICDTCSSGMWFDNNDCFGPVTAANSSLIAAAPELLEALQDAEKALFVALDNAFGEELANGNRELIQARAAISKALGEKNE